MFRPPKHIFQFGPPAWKVGTPAVQDLTSSLCISEFVLEHGIGKYDSLGIEATKGSKERK
jgi:hypothetical protein